ncbi:MAG: lipopolysaccharide biosynthesis protein [Candidatus Kapaibacterium sp.]
MADSTEHTSANGLGRFFSTGLIIAAGDALSLVSGAVFVIALARLAGAETLGRFSFVLALAGIAQTICDAGFDITLPRTIGAEPAYARTETRKALGLKSAMCAIVLPVVLVFAMAKDGTDLPFSLLMILDVVPSTLSYALVCSLRGLRRSDEAARINAAYNGVPYLLAAGSLVLSPSLPLCAALLLAGDVLKFIHLRALFMRVAPPDTHGTETASLPLLTRLGSSWSEQGSVTSVNIISSLLVRLPVVMLGWIGTDTFAGYYSAAARFTTAARILPGAFLHSILPGYAKRQSDAPRIRAVIVSTTLASASIGALLALVAPMLMEWTFRFAESVAILRVLSIGFIVLSIKTVLEGFLLATHQERIVTLVLVVTMLLAALGYALSARVSALSVAWCTVAAELLACIGFAVVLLRWSADAKRRSTVTDGGAI